MVLPVGLCFVDAAADYPLPFSTPASDELPDFMNGPVKNMLGIIPPEVTWRTCKLSTVVFFVVQNRGNVTSAGAEGGRDDYHLCFRLGRYQYAK